MVGEIRADLQDFQKMKKYYARANGDGVRDYVGTLIRDSAMLAT
jgi:hypothetical protein